MARITNSLMEALSGSVGELVFYQVGGKTYSRRKPGKQSKATKARTSPAKRRSQSVISQTQAFLKNIAPILRFGYQNHTDGARRPYHAAVSYTSKNCFKEEEKARILEVSLVKVSLGTLTGPQDPRAVRVTDGVEFSWTDNSEEGSARFSDQAFVVLHSTSGQGSDWVFLGSFRSIGKHKLPFKNSNSNTQWHAWIAFSQENPWTKKRTLSDSVYLGIV